MKNSPTPKPRRSFAWVMRIVFPLLLLALAPLALIAGCQSKMIYFPRPYAPGTTAEWQQRTAGKIVEFETSEGRQRAFLQGNLTTPRHLWVVCGGNGTVALDWSEWLQQNAPAQDAWLLVDFPGYGDCSGAPSPASIRETFRTGMPVAFQAIGWPTRVDPARLRFFGHSLGAAACLIAASELGIQRGVLISPFTSTMDMTRAMTGLPLGFLIWHRFDNAARLAEISARGPAEIHILHGSEDEVIPVSMSRTLAAEHPAIVRFKEIPGGRHNTIQMQNPQEVIAALSAAAESVSNR